jgi:hypothetical protein
MPRSFGTFIDFIKYIVESRKQLKNKTRTYKLSSYGIIIAMYRLAKYINTIFAQIMEYYE